MEAKELMLNDLVSITNGTDVEYAKVCEIKGDTIKLNIHVEWEDFTCNYIPLSEDILNANGFFVVEDGTAYKYRCGVYLLDVRYKIGEIDIYEEKGHWTSGYVCRSVKVSPFNYVHELQRALRCCGLWDLANNFKIGINYDTIRN